MLNVKINLKNSSNGTTADAQLGPFASVRGARFRRWRGFADADEVIKPRINRHAVQEKCCRIEDQHVPHQTNIRYIGQHAISPIKDKRIVVAWIKDAPSSSFVEWHQQHRSFFTRSL